MSDEPTDPENDPQQGEPLEDVQPPTPAGDPELGKGGKPIEETEGGGPPASTPPRDINAFPEDIEGGGPPASTPPPVPPRALEPEPVDEPMNPGRAFLRSGAPSPPRSARAAASRPPVPPPAALLKKDESPLMQFMHQRMELMERELIKERERAHSSENLLKQQDALRSEVETQLKNLSKQLKAEKEHQQLAEDKQVSRGRIDSLEKRLDEMHQTWAGLLRDTISKRESDVAMAGPEVQALTGGLHAIQEEMARLKSELSTLPGLVPEMRRISESLPTDAARRAAEEKALREHLSVLVDRMSESLVDRMKGLSRHLNQELGQYQERLAVLAREREALREAMDEQRHNIRQQYLKERVSIESQFNTQLETLKESLKGISERQSGTGAALAAIEELTKQLHTVLTRPAQAKDQMLQELEQEKRDLMKALKDRSAQMRAADLERREVEHSLGESLMELNRQIEAERSKNRQRVEHSASLQNTVDALRAESALKDKESEQKDQRFRALADERDSLVRALAEEAEKVKKQIAGRMETDNSWEKKILDLQDLINAEREKRLQAESSVSELRAQVQTLSEHITRVLRDKEDSDKQSMQWHTQRQELHETLRKKDEMISMLSATFQNLLRKPQ